MRAVIDDDGWRKGSGLRVAEPVLIRLESLQVALETDGSEIALLRVGGSKRDSEDLCELVDEPIRIATNQTIDRFLPQVEYRSSPKLDVQAAAHWLRRRLLTLAT